MNILKKPVFLLVALSSFFLVAFIACAQQAPATQPAQKSQQPANIPTANIPTANIPTEELVKGVASFNRNFVIVFDDSGSMDQKSCGKNPLKVEVSPGNFAETRIGVARWAAEKFVQESVPQDVNLGFYPLNNSGRRVPLAKDNREQILEAVRAMRGSGGTPLNGALREATNLLIAQRNLQLGYGEFYIVVVTDGEATDNGGKDARVGAEYALANDVMIITIGFCLEEGHALARYSLSYRNALSGEDLLKALKETQAELKEYDSQ